MDKLTHYRDLIKHVLLEHADLANQTASKIQTFCALDDERGTYLLVRAGWEGYKRLRIISVFIRLVGQSIHIEEDITEEGVANALIKAGVSRDEVVPAFQSPDVRRLNQAVAV